MKKIEIEIGDCSGDGHGISEIVSLRCNRTIKQLKDLYIKSCKLTGLQFTTNGDDSGRNRDWSEMEKWKVLQDYQQNHITEFQKQEFLKYGLSFKNLDFTNETNRFTELFLSFLELSDKELKWLILNEPENPNKLQLFIGYGIYDDH